MGFSVEFRDCGSDGGSEGAEGQCKLARDVSAGCGEGLMSEFGTAFVAWGTGEPEWTDSGPMAWIAAVEAVKARQACKKQNNSQTRIVRGEGGCLCDTPSRENGDGYSASA